MSTCERVSVPHTLCASERERDFCFVFCLRGVTGGWGGGGGGGGGGISGLAFFLAEMISYNYGSVSRRALSRAQGIQRPSVRR